LVALTLAAAAAASGPAPFHLQAPEGFVRFEEPAFGGSAALLPLLEPGARRAVVEAWVDLAAGASLVLGRVEAPLESGREPALEIPAAIAGHLRGELDLEATVGPARREAGPLGPRWEARASTRAGEGPRTVRFAFYPAGAVHYVLAASYAPDAEAKLAERLAGTFERFAPVAEQAPRRWAQARWAALAGALVVIAALAAARRRRRAEDALS